MNTRVDLLPDQRLMQRMKALRKNVDEVRQQQQVGSLSVQTFRIFSGGIDLTVSNIKYNNTIVEVAFTPASTAKGLGGVLDFGFVKTDTANSCNLFQEAILPANGISKWRLYLNGNDSYPATSQFTFYFLSNALGTFTASTV